MGWHNYTYLLLIVPDDFFRTQSVKSSFFVNFFKVFTDDYLHPLGGFMRRHLSRRKSARVFRKGNAVKKINHQPTMGRRGGIRL